MKELEHTHMPTLICSGLCSQSEGGAGTRKGVLCVQFDPEDQLRDQDLLESAKPLPLHSGISMVNRAELVKDF